MITANIIKMLKFVNKLFSSSNEKKLQSYSKVIAMINSLEKEIILLSDTDLQKKNRVF